MNNKQKENYKLNTKTLRLESLGTMEHCSVVYYWRTLEKAQELNEVFQDSKDIPESYGKDWNEFLNHMAQERWELTGAVSIISSGIARETLAYFKRPSSSVIVET